MEVKKVFKLTGMHCKNCETLLKEVVRELVGVKSVYANAARNEVTVEFDSDALGVGEIREAIEKDGYYKVREVVSA